MEQGPVFHRAPGALDWIEAIAASPWVWVLGVSLAVLALIWLTRRRKRSACKWRRDMVPRENGLQRWQCGKCGVDAFTSDGRAPKECKRALRETQL